MAKAPLFRFVRVAQIKNAKTLRALERAGFIKEPPMNCRPKGVTWGKEYSYVESAVVNSTSFTHKKRSFFLKYRDGCFFPFVFEFLSEP